jgi:hypothetical protein
MGDLWSPMWRSCSLRIHEEFISKNHVHCTADPDDSWLSSHPLETSYGDIHSLKQLSTSTPPTTHLNTSGFKQQHFEKEWIIQMPKRAVDIQIFSNSRVTWAFSLGFGHFKGFPEPFYWQEVTEPHCLFIFQSLRRELLPLWIKILEVERKQSLLSPPP